MRRYYAENCKTESETNQKHLTDGGAICGMRSQTAAFRLLLLADGTVFHFKTSLPVKKSVETLASFSNGWEYVLTEFELTAVSSKFIR